MIYEFQDRSFYPENGVLRQGSQEQVLRPKTAQVLQFLMDHAGNLVTKEQILEHVWPNAHVSAGNLVQSIQEIRRALGDSAKDPQFVKTFPRRGYQWLVAVKSSTNITPPEPLAAVKATETAPISPEPSLAQPKSRFISGLWLPGVLILAGLLWYFWPKTQPQPVVTTSEGPLRLAMLPILDETGEPSLDWMAPGIYQLTQERLAASAQTTVLTKVQLLDALSKQGLDTQTLTEEQSQRLLQATDSHMLLQSRIERHGTQFRYAYQLTKLDQGTANGSFSFTNPLVIAGQIADLFTVHPNPKPKGPQYSKINEANKDFFRAKQALETQSASLAKRYYEAALLQDPQFEIARLGLAWAHYLMGELPEAQGLYERVLATCQSSKSAYNQILSLQGLGRIQWRLGRMQLSDQSIEDALKLAKTHGYPMLEARSLRLLAWHAIHMGEWRKHDRYEQQAQELSLHFNDEKSAVDGLYHMGSSDSPQHNHEQGRLLLLMARDYYEKTGATADLAYTYSALGRNRASTPQQQEQYLQKAMTLFQQLEYHIMIPGIWEAIALCHAQYAAPQKFKEVILKAHQVYEEKGYEGDLANTQFLLAIVALMEGISQPQELEPYLTQAEYWLDQCKNFHAQQSILSRQGSSHLVRGMIAMARGNFNVAETHFEQGMEVYEHLEFPEGIAVCAVAKASLALEQGAWAQAVQWANKAGEVYPERPGLWKPYAIHAHLNADQPDSALQLAQAWRDLARPKTKQTAEDLYQYCTKIRDGKTAVKPAQPHVIFTYFQSY